MSQRRSLTPKLIHRQLVLSMHIAGLGTIGELDLNLKDEIIADGSGTIIIRIGSQDYPFDSEDQYLNLDEFDRKILTRIVWAEVVKRTPPEILNYWTA